MSENEARALIDQLTCEERLTLYQFLKAMKKERNQLSFQMRVLLTSVERM